MPDHLEFPRPLRLLWTITWNLIESAGLPIGALAVGAWLYGRDAGLLAGLAATWLTALIRKIAGECGTGQPGSGRTRRVSRRRARRNCRPPTLQ